ncbi:hypothetical protein [Halalkalibacter alkalisediminis]|uniref:DUF2564 family protein n=1 Tax=Halalkalibacter alkalisediminis TaxID=935616 RepID=A0ABV6NK88_9BACI|nr:hypothetical protein [Halalkalibacter alkalisediminis]
MKNNISSLQTQNEIFQAQQSVEHVQNAVSQALSHPNKQLIDQAYNSIEKAEHALGQASDFDNQDAIQLVREELEAQKQALQKLPNQH